MKQLFIVICMLFISFSTTYAQRGKQAVGFGLNYGTEIESLGIGFKYQYNITDPIRIEPSANYFFEYKGVSMFDINLNIHYLFPMATNVKVYPLMGFTYSNWNLAFGSLDYATGKSGVNLGAGAEFILSKRWSGNIEIKYQLIDTFNQGVFNMGLAYRF